VTLSDRFNGAVAVNARYFTQCTSFRSQLRQIHRYSQRQKCSR